MRYNFYKYRNRESEICNLFAILIVTNFLNEKKQIYKEKEREKLKLKLLKSMRDMSEEAIRNGVTPEILDKILNEC